MEGRWVERRENGEEDVGEEEYEMKAFRDAIAQEGLSETSCVSLSLSGLADVHPTARPYHGR